MTLQLATDVLIVIIWFRKRPVALLYHSNQGSQNVSEDYRWLLIAQCIARSMSRTGNFWATR